MVRRPGRRKTPRAGLPTTIGGILAGFDAQVMRSLPPAHELVHHARPDGPIATGDGGGLVIGWPDSDAIDVTEGAAATDTNDGEDPDATDR